MKNQYGKGILFALLAATLYAINAPFSKLILQVIPSTLLAGLLYIGAGLGMGVIGIFRRAKAYTPKEERLKKKDLPYTIAMILLDIAAPIFLLLGLSYTTAANASLLNNFEIVATALIALAVFCEKISPRLWCGIACVTTACAILSFEDVDSFNFSLGSLYVLLAAVCWGVENNCTRKLAEKDPLQIVLLKGIFSGLGSLVIGLVIGERTQVIWGILAALLLGFVAYGLSIYFYVYAQRFLGAARTSAYYAVAPFIGTLLSLLIFGETPPGSFFIALGFMIFGVWLSAKDGMHVSAERE